MRHISYEEEDNLGGEKTHVKPKKMGKNKKKLKKQQK
jgi:hypothetical protein